MPVTRDFKGSLDLVLGRLTQAGNETVFDTPLQDIHSRQALSVLVFIHVQVDESVGHDSNAVVNGAKALFDQSAIRVDLFKFLLGLEWQVLRHLEV